MRLNRNLLFFFNFLPNQVIKQCARVYRLFFWIVLNFIFSVVALLVIIVPGPKKISVRDKFNLFLFPLLPVLLKTSIYCQNLLKYFILRTFSFLINVVTHSKKLK